jgi:hypothetical protein
VGDVSLKQTGQIRAPDSKACSGLTLQELHGGRLIGVIAANQLDGTGQAGSALARGKHKCRRSAAKSLQKLVAGEPGIRIHAFRKGIQSEEWDPQAGPEAFIGTLAVSCEGKPWLLSDLDREGQSQDGQGGQLANLMRSDRTIDRDSGDHFSDDRLSQSRNMNQARDLLRLQESGDHARAMIA